MTETSLILLTIFVTCILAYPDFVPNTEQVCKSMIPGHGPTPQTSPAPCKITVNRPLVRSGRQIVVTISALDGVEGFKGFFLQARNDRDGPIGTFSESSSNKVHSCNNIIANGAHHSGGHIKKAVKVLWKAPAKFRGEVVFTATCVKEFNTFWTQIKSEPVKISETLIKKQMQTTSSPSSAPTSSTATSPTVSSTYSRYRRFGNSYVMGDGAGRRPRILTGIKPFKHENKPTISNSYVEEDPNHNYNNLNHKFESGKLEIENGVLRNNDTVSQIIPTSTNYDQQVISFHNSNSPSTSSKGSGANSNNTSNKRQVPWRNNLNSNFNYHYVTPNSHEFYTENSHLPPAQPPQSAPPTFLPTPSLREPVQLVSPKIESFKMKHNGGSPVKKNNDYEHGHFSPRPVLPPPIFPYASTSDSNSNLNANNNPASVYPIHIIANHHQLTQQQHNKNQPNSIRDKLQGTEHGLRQAIPSHHPNTPFDLRPSSLVSPNGVGGPDDGPYRYFDTTGETGPAKSRFVYPKMQSGFRPNTFPIPLNKLKEGPYYKNEQQLKLKLEKPGKAFGIGGSGSGSSAISNSLNFPVPIYQFYPSDNLHDDHRKRNEGYVFDFGTGIGSQVPPPTDGYFSTNDGLSGFGISGGRNQGHVHENERDFQLGQNFGEGAGGVHLPRYGYLIYNPKRGPPFYIIPQQEYPHGLTQHPAQSHLFQQQQKRESSTNVDDLYQHRIIKPRQSIISNDDSN